MAAMAGAGEGHGHQQGQGRQQGHGHDGPEDFDWADRGDELERDGEVWLPLTRAMVTRLADEREHGGVGHVVDVGAGPGVAACVLAQVFDSAEVTVMDAAEPLLERATARAERLGLGDRVRTRPGDLNDVSDLPRADVIWASMTVHHTPDPAATIRGLGQRLRVGGVLALVEGGLPTRFWHGDLGTPGLTARLDAAVGTAIAGHRGSGSGLDVRFDEDWPALLRAAGLVDVTSRSHLLDLPAPLDDAARHYVRSHLEILLTHAGEHLSEADRAAVDRLLDPDDPEGVDRKEGLFVLSASTLHTGRRAG